MIRRILPAILCCCLATAAVAASLAGVTVRDTYPLDGQNLVLNGVGLRTLTIFHIRVYVAALYVAQPSHDAQQILNSPGPKVVVLVFLHDATKAQIEHQYREGEEKNCGHGECSPADGPDFERLVAAAPGMVAGDSSTYVFTERGIQVYANRTLVMESANKDFAYHILASFIGEYPPSPELRSELLGLPGG